LFCSHGDNAKDHTTLKKVPRRLQQQHQQKRPYRNIRRKHRTQAKTNSQAATTSTITAAIHNADDYD
jgi:hypothetical protein